MEIITFDKLPEAVSLLLEKVTRIENLLNGPPLQQPEQDEPLNIKRALNF